VGGALAWPTIHLVYRTGRIEGAGVLAVAGVVYTAVSLLVMYQFILQPKERSTVEQKFFAWRNRAAIA
jgi:hypothetical protein